MIRKSFSSKVLSVLISWVLCVPLVSCGILSDPGEGPGQAKGAAAGTSARGQPATGSSEVLFNLTQTAGKGTAAAVPAWSEEESGMHGAGSAAGLQSEASRIHEPPGEDALTPAPRSGAHASSYEALVERLQEGLSTEWSEVSGGLNGESSKVVSARRTQVACRLVASTFLRDNGASPETAVLSAVEAAGAPDSAPEYRLLAAAYLLRSGFSDEAMTIVREVSAGSASRVTVNSAGPFRLANLAFARSIEGAGRFVPAEATEVVPGKTVLVYGEFENATTVREAPGADGEGYRRSFSAHLVLLDAHGDELDRLDFLPESRGSQVCSQPQELVNFWARYKVPSDLEPGQYRIAVHGRDMLGGSVASAELEFTVSRAASRPRH